VSYAARQSCLQSATWAFESSTDLPQDLSVFFSVPPWSASARNRGDDVAHLLDAATDDVGGLRCASLSMAFRLIELPGEHRCCCQSVAIWRRTRRDAGAVIPFETTAVLSRRTPPLWNGKVDADLVAGPAFLVDTNMLDPWAGDVMSSGVPPRLEVVELLPDRPSCAFVGPGSSPKSMKRCEREWRVLLWRRA
jgi:hypothetical protein